MKNELHTPANSPEVKRARRCMSDLARAVTAAKCCRSILDGPLDAFRSRGEIVYLHQRLLTLRDEVTSTSELFERYFEQFARPVTPERESSVRASRKKKRKNTGK